MKKDKILMSTCLRLIFCHWLAVSQYLFALSPPSLSGWTHAAKKQGVSTLQPGVVTPGGPVVFSSTAVAEIDGIGTNGLEVAVASADGIVQLFSAQGKLIWSTQTPNFGCGSSNDRIYSSPAIGNLNGDRQQFVVIGYGGFNGNCDGGVVAIHGKNGKIAWTFSLKQFAKRRHYAEAHYAVYSTPSLADTDGDGRLEVGFGGLDRNVYLLNNNGRVRWYYNAADTVFSSAAFVNVNRDHFLEMIIGTDISRNDSLRPPTKNGGFLYAFRTQLPLGSDKHLKFNSRSSFVWKRHFNQVIQSSPVVAEVLSSSAGSEVVIGSGCFFPQESNEKNGKWVKILRLKDGKVLKTLVAPGCLSSSPAIGDIDNDEQLEIVATVNGGLAPGGDKSGKVVAWNPSIATPLWSVVPRTAGGNDSYLGKLQSPILADLDGNGSLEVIVANQSGISILNGRDGKPLTCTTARCAGSDVMLETNEVLKSTPTVSDINLDGVPELIIGGSKGDDGIIYAWTSFESVLDSPVGALPQYFSSWPTLRGNSRRNGRYRSGLQ